MIRQMRKTLLAVIITFSIYAIAVAVRSDIWSNLLAPVCDLLAAGIIFHSVYHSCNTKFRTNFTLIGLSICSWASADILWAIYSWILHSNPENSELISVLYMGTNIFLFVATILYCIYRFRKWDSFQLILDSALISIAVLWLLWVLVFDKRFDALGLLQQDNVVNIISIVMDMIEIILISVWYLSIRKGNTPLYLRIISGGAFFYTIVDFIYFYLLGKGLYIPNSFIDICYMAAFFGLAIGTKLFFIQCPSGRNTQKVAHSNIGHQRRGLFIILAPILILIFKGFDWFDILFFIMLIFLHEGFSSYIQAAISNQKILARELNLNHELELRISERTKDLEQKNEELQRFSEELRKKNVCLRYITDHDPLTGLYNRGFFLRRLENKIKGLSPDKKLILLLWDVNCLKNINNTYGHSTGDKVLIALARRVKNITEETGDLARLNGDEFAFTLSGDFEKHEIGNIAERITNACNELIQIGEYSFHVTISLGVSIFPLCAIDADTLLKNADVAMHHAKNTGNGNCISFYNDIDSVMKRKNVIVNLLRKADYNKEFYLYYQPQFRTADQKLIGMEALLRWNCPELGFISPAEFIPIAEEENLIVPIGNWVIENAIRQIADWNHSFHEDLKVGINLSPKQLDQTDILEVFNSSMQMHQVKAEWIDIEITEGVAIESDDKAQLIKDYFQSQGISISIDDFGTGYSSLGYLNMLSFNRIKIPKPLIDNITSDESSLKIVSSIISLARSLEIQTVSEGVETKEQFDLLLNLNCDQIQGYYLGKPLPPYDFEKAFLNGCSGAALVDISNSDADSLR